MILDYFPEERHTKETFERDLTASAERKGACKASFEANLR